ncbi:hypothetical protein BGZ95_003874 [Linnemannia exigua]|uniref:NET domain-containing protein n=1 Tax=Linnemannia exigua TaxID=604196 RepID=A0AAD4D3N8_9FUNG|nr:hypothetical protein BGZ95_003874 [Linnemannia exigua]
MGAITLVDTPTEIEGSFSNLKNLSQAEVLHRLALDANNLASQGLIQQHQGPSAGSFSISDFLVPGLQTKSWEDWQVTDELNPFATTADAQTYSANLAPMSFQFGLDGMMMGDATWDAATAGLPSDMTYDEFVFELSPSHFSTPATINVADLIVGPESVTSSTVVSPRDLQMPLSHTTFEDLAMADFYGFTEHDDAGVFDSDSGSDLSDVDSLSDDDDEDDDDDEKAEEEVVATNKTNNLAPISESVVDLEDATYTLALSAASTPQFASQQTRIMIEDPNKRRMEEALVARINNDLGPEHMSGLFKILRGGDAEDDDEDEELEVDLSRLDETPLVQLYQYVETCCMQTLGLILAAEKEEQERQKKDAAAAAAALEAAKKAQQEQEAREYARELEMRSTPELSPSHYSSSSSSPSVSPSPPHHSSYSATECGSSNNKKRSATNSTSCTTKYERNDVEKQAEALWMNSQHKSKRKRMNNNSPVCMGGGGTGKGQRIKKSMMMMDQEEQQLQQLQQQQQQGEESEEIGEDDEIDIVGF